MRLELFRWASSATCTGWLERPICVPDVQVETFGEKLSHGAGQFKEACLRGGSGQRGIFEVIGPLLPMIEISVGDLINPLHCYQFSHNVF